MSNLSSSAALFIKRNGSTILSCLGGAGVIATSVMAVKATPKALERVEEIKPETTLEKVKVVAPIYIPTAIMGVATIACIFGANVLNKQYQASLISAYALLDNSYREYREKIVDMYGQDADREAKEEIAKDKYAGDEIKVDNDKQLFYDEFSKRYFESTIYHVQRAEYEINRDIQMGGYSTVNDFYESLDMDPIEGGDVLGWSEGGNLARYWQSWVDFNHHKVTMDDGLECYIVSMFQEPYLDYENDGDDF